MSPKHPENPGNLRLVDILLHLTIYSPMALVMLPVAAESTGDRLLTFDLNLDVSIRPMPP